MVYFQLISSCLVRERATMFFDPEYESKIYLNYIWSPGDMINLYLWLIKLFKSSKIHYKNGGDLKLS